NLLQIPGGRGGKFKLATLTELHQYLFGIPFSEAHNATADVEATTRCFLELVKREVFTADELKVELPYFQEFKNRNADVIQPIGLKHLNLKQASEEIAKRQQKENADARQVTQNAELQDLVSVDFVHLHNHTQFSVLQSTI